MPRPKLLVVPAPILLAALIASACTVAYRPVDDTRSFPRAKVRPGISVLMKDSIGLIRGKKIGLLTNRSATDEKGVTDITLLTSDTRMTTAKAQLTMLFAPEHGLSATEDRTNLPSQVDTDSRIPVYSLYGSQTSGPPDSLISKIDVLVVDLPDVGSRTWTYQGAMVYAMRAAARAGKPIIVLDRPNPLTGATVEGPLLDTALANADDPTPDKPGRAYALYPIPLRHGMTIGELARFYNDVLNIKADLRVVPVQGWRREIWGDLAGLPFKAPSPNLTSFKSVMLYPGLVAFEATNLSVGRGTETPFQVVAAPWLDPDKVIKALNEQKVRGVRFLKTTVTPVAPGDGKYNGEALPGIFIQVADRNELHTSRLTAAILSAVHAVHPQQFTIKAREFDTLFGSTAAREAILKGDNPDTVIDQAYVPAYTFREQAKKYLLY